MSCLTHCQQLQRGGCHLLKSLGTQPTTNPSVRSVTQTPKQKEEEQEWQESPSSFPDTEGGPVVTFLLLGFHGFLRNRRTKVIKITCAARHRCPKGIEENTLMVPIKNLEFLKCVLVFTEQSIQFQELYSAALTLRFMLIMRHQESTHYLSQASGYCPCRSHFSLTSLLSATSKAWRLHLLCVSKPFRSEELPQSFL